MSKKLVRREVDLAHLPPLTEKQKAELTRSPPGPTATSTPAKFRH